MIQPIGKLVVATPGTLIGATSTLQHPTKVFPIHGVMFQALPTNVGLVYIGRASMNRSTLEDVFAILPIPTSNVLPTFSVALTISPNGLVLNEFYIDADEASDGALCSILQT